MFLLAKKWNVGDRLKRILSKFEAERRHPQEINGRSKFRIFQKCETLNGRLPPEIRSYSRENWGNRVSDDSAFFIFWPRKFFGARCAVAMGAAAVATAGTKRNATVVNGR